MSKKLTLSDQLRAGRAKRGISAADLAASIGVSVASIYFWEHGWHRPRDQNLAALCRALRLPIRATRALT